MATIFEMHGVSIQNIQPDSDFFKGEFRVSWIERGNRRMVDIFEYENLSSRKTAIAEALKRAAGEIEFTDY